MQKMLKYGEQYLSLSNIHDLPKRPPNAMKGRPLLVYSGSHLQYQQKNYNLLISILIWITASVLIQYNLSNREYKGPYVDRLFFKNRFDYKLKKRKKRPQFSRNSKPFLETENSER
jgi:hypothetical protein